jgi:ABC-type transporter Mla MlaB component
MLRDKSGNVAIIFALSLLPLMLAVGMAVDVTNMLSTKSKMQDALDAAALAALAESTPTHMRQQVAEKTFLSSLPESLRNLSPTFSITIKESGPERSATAAYSLNMPLAFAGIIGVSSMDIAGQTASGIEIGGSMDIHLWLDSSASMGVAATEQDRDKLKALTGCFFACHQDGPPTSQKKAHDNGITLRLDLMKQNVLALMEKIHEVQIPEQVVRYSISGMAKTFEPRAAMTEDYNAIYTAVKNFSLSGTTHSQAASRLTPALSTAKGTLPAQNGDGTKDNPRHFVVIVTDGMQFDWHSISPGPITNTSCENIKSRGIPISVIQLRYVPDPGNVHYEHWVAPHFHQLGPALQACASPGMFYSADTPAQIQEAFAELAVRIRGALRLMN